MSERIKQGVSYASVGIVCAILGAVLSLRIYAGLPERLDELRSSTEQRLTEVRDHTAKLEARVQANEDRLAADMRHIHASLAEIKTLVRMNH